MKNTIINIVSSFTAGLSFVQMINSNEIMWPITFVISLLWIISTTIEILLDINESKLKGEDEKEDN